MVSMGLAWTQIIDGVRSSIRVALEKLRLEDPTATIELAGGILLVTTRGKIYRFPILPGTKRQYYVESQYFIKIDQETMEEVFHNHHGGGYPSIDEAEHDALYHMDEYPKSKMTIVDSDGRVVKKV